jgi:hypothetical protein
MQRTLIEDTVLPALKLGLTPINAFSVKATDQPLAKGEVTTVPVLSAATSGTYSTTYESGDTTVTGTAVTMAAPTYSSWHFNPQIDQVQMTPELWLGKAAEATYAVTKTVVQGVLAKFVGANIGSTGDTDTKTITAANYDVSDQADLWGMLKTKGVEGQVSAIHTVDYAAALLKDSALTDLSASGERVLMTGELPMILGARQFYTDAFPTAVTSENTGVIYTGKTTAAVALAIPQSIDDGLVSGSGTRVMVLTDPDTGLSLQFREWYNSGTGVFWGSVAVMYGTSFVQDAAVRIISA